MKFSKTLIISITIILLLSVLSLAADIIILKNGDRVEGKIIEENDTVIKIQVSMDTRNGPIKITRTIRKKTVKEIKRHQAGTVTEELTTLDVFNQKLALLDKSNLADILALASWGKKNGLGRQAINLETIALARYTETVNLLDVQTAKDVKAWCLRQSMSDFVVNSLSSSVQQALLARKQISRTQMKELEKLLSVYEFNYDNRAKIYAQGLDTYFTQHQNSNNIADDMIIFLAVYEQYDSKLPNSKFFRPILDQKIASTSAKSERDLKALAKWANEHGVLLQSKPFLEKSFKDLAKRLIVMEAKFSELIPPRLNASTDIIDEYKRRKNELTESKQHYIELANALFLHKHAKRIAGALKASAGQKESPLFRGNPSHSGYYPFGLGKLKEKTKIKKLLYFGSEDGYLYALNPDDGTEVWKFYAGGKIQSSPIPVNGVVYFGSNNKSFYAVKALTGTRIWEFKTEGMILASPAVVNGRVYFCSEDKFVYCVSTATGLADWKVNLKGAAYTTPAVADGKVYLGISSTEQYYALNAVDGKIVWQRKLGHVYYSSATIVDDILVVGTILKASDYEDKAKNRALYGLSTTSGATHWKVNLNADVTASAAVVDDIVYVGTTKNYRGNAGNRFYALSVKTGQKYWEVQFNSSVHSSAVVSGGTVYVGDWRGTLHALDKSTGAKQWTCKTSNSIYASPALVEGVIYIASHDYRLHAVNATTGEKLWKFKTDGRISSSPSYAEGLEQED